MIWKTIFLIALLIHTPASAQTLQSMDAKLDAILRALNTQPPPPIIVPPPVPPPPPPPSDCKVKTTGGRFAVGDKLTFSNGWQMRSAPSLDIIATASRLKGDVDVVTCVEQVGTDQWLQTGGLWAREGCCDGGKVIIPDIPPPPPPPIDPIPGASYYLSNAGSDTNPGTNNSPFLTLGKAIPLIKPGEVLVIRGGTYDTGGFTGQGGETIFNTGVSWALPITIQAAPGEKVKFVRDLAPGSTLTVEQVRAGVHAPTEAQCKFYATQVPGSFLPYPEKCWAGSPAFGWLWLFQDDTGGTTGPLLDLTNNKRPIQFLQFKNIDWDGRGIAKSIISTSTMADCEPTAKNIRFFNADIGYSAASAFTQPGTCDNDSKGVRNVSNIQLFDSKVHHCGIPFDPARKNPWAKYLHCFYMHIGGNEVVRSEIYEAAGGGFEPDGHFNKLIDSYIHDTACLGAQVGGGDQQVITGNVFYNSGCGLVQALSGERHLFANNTLVCGPSNNELGLQVTFRNSDVLNNIITGCRTSIYSLQPWDTANRYRNNLIDGLHTIGNGTIAPVVSGMITGDPKLDSNYRPLAGSPALKAGTDGKNIGAK